MRGAFETYYKFDNVGNWRQNQRSQHGNNERPARGSYQASRDVGRDVQEESARSVREISRHQSLARIQRQLVKLFASHGKRGDVPGLHAKCTSNNKQALWRRKRLDRMILWNVEKKTKEKCCINWLLFFYLKSLKFLVSQIKQIKCLLT